MKVSDEFRDLIIRYMEACNERDFVKAESLLQKIKEQSIKDQLNESNS